MADLLIQPSSVSPGHLNQLTRALHKPKSIPASSTTTSSQPNKTSHDPQSLFGPLSKAVQGASDLWRSRRAVATKERRQARRLEETKDLLHLRMKNARSLEQWQAAAQELDALEGNDWWKNDSSSSTEDFNPALIEERLRALDNARASGDIQTMMHLIRTSLSRNLGGMGNVELYKHSYLGTKTLIERYVDSTIQTIDAVIVQSASDRRIAYRDLLEGMLLARQSFGRSALLLSGGGTFGMAHIGVLKTLFEARLLPRIISGASAGAIVCAVMCTKTDEEIPDLIRGFPYGDLAVFDPADKPDSILDHMRRLFTEGSWSDIKHLGRVMRDMMGDITFQEAYNRTRRILNICVSNESMYELPRLLNYVTAPNVMIWSAVAASCSVPLVFNGSSLLVKDPASGEHRPWNPTPQRWIDGSVENDLPMTRLAEMFNVNHFIVSQVNPHVSPFLPRDEYSTLGRGLGDALQSHSNNSNSSSSIRSINSINNSFNAVKAGRGDGYDWLQTLTSLARDEALHRLNFMAEMGFFPNVMTKVRSVLSQRYSGDINILPEMTLDNLPVILSNPTVEFMLKCSLVGQHATWPKLSRIRDCCAVELALDRAVHRLRTRVVFSESQSELRYLAANNSGSGSSNSNGNNSNKNAHSEAFRPATQDATSPLFSSPGTAAAATATIGALFTVSGPAPYKRRRRQSGSSLLTVSNPMMMMVHGDISDDDTGEEERLEMATRTRSLPSTGPGARKPVLKRASRSSTHIPQYGRIPISPARLDTVFLNQNLDLSNPLISAMPMHDEAGPMGADMAPPILSQMESVGHTETVEQGQSSDADVEQAAEDSDPDPYDSSDTVFPNGLASTRLASAKVAHEQAVPAKHGPFEFGWGVGLQTRKRRQ